MYRDFIIVLKGAFIGLANLIPGLSGGTLAVILGIYDRLIGVFSDLSFGRIKKEDIFFAVKIFIGASLSIIILSQVVEHLFAEHYLFTMFAFSGLVVGGIPVIIMSQSDMKFSLKRSAAFFLGVFSVAFIVYLDSLTTGGSHTASLFSPGYLALASAGFLAGGAMIIPGLSGSLVLVIMGQYVFVLSSIRQKALMPILIFLVGALFGIAVFSRIMAVCLRRYPSGTHYFILGLVLASCVKMFPGVPSGIFDILVSSMFFCCGAFISFYLGRIST